MARLDGRWLLGLWILTGCKGKDGSDDSTSTGTDDSDPTATGADHVTATVFGTIGSTEVDALEPVHVVGGALAELANVPEFNELVTKGKSKLAPPPPPIGEVTCVSTVVKSMTEVTIDYTGCSDDRDGSIHLVGTAPTVAVFQDFGVFGYVLSGTVVFTDADIGFDLASEDVLIVSNIERSAEVGIDGNLFADYLPDGDELMQLEATVEVSEGGASHSFKVGDGGKGALSLNPAYPLTYSLEASTPRRPIAGTVVFDVTSGSFAADITKETIELELGIAGEIPKAGIMDLPVTLTGPMVVGVSYGKKSAMPGVQVDADTYPGTVSASDVVAQAQDCALSQEDCDALASALDAALADTVTVDIGWAVIASAFGVAYGAAFDPALQPVK